MVFEESDSGNILPSSSIFNDTIVAADIAADAIGSSELEDNAVDTGAIQNLAVTSAKVATSVANTGRNVAFSMIFGSQTQKKSRAFGAILAPSVP